MNLNNAHIAYSTRLYKLRIRYNLLKKKILAAGLKSNESQGSDE